MRVKRSCWVVMAAGVLLGCGDDSKVNALSVSPSSAQVLTCGQGQFSAALAGATVAPQVTWAVDPAGGTINAQGMLTAPTSAAPGLSATVTATSVDDATQKGTAQVEIATAFPASAVGVAPSATLESVNTVYPHALAASGHRVYAVFSAATGGGMDDVLLVRSDDGGATWGTPVAVNGATRHGFSCPAVAIDPANPDVVYVSYLSDGGGTGIFPTPDGVTATGDTLVLATSENGGATFTNRPLIIDGNANEPQMAIAQACADVAAPAANAVAVLSPGAPDPSYPDWPDLELFVDTARGAGFDAPGEQSDGNYLSAGYRAELADASDDEPLLANGGDRGPRLFSDGASHLCATWIQANPDDGEAHAVRVACSANAGQSWSAPALVDPGETLRPLDAAGSFAPDGHAVVAVLRTDGEANRIDLAWSHDAGATFGALAQVPMPEGWRPTTVRPLFQPDGILWLAYEADDDGGGSAYVDKSCDLGASFSGPVAFDAEAETAGGNGKHPTLAVGDVTPLAADLFDSGSEQGRMRVFPLAPRSP